MKNKVMWMVIGWVLVAGVVWTLSAYSTQIWSPVQFVKQLFVTPNGEIDQSKATIKIDGTKWRIDAKSIYENGVQVATKGDLDSYATKIALNKLKKTLWNSSWHIVKTCNFNNIGLPNSYGEVCGKTRVTNISDCINDQRDHVIDQWRLGNKSYNSMCANGRLRKIRRPDPKKRRKTTYVGFTYVYTFKHYLDH